MSERRTLVKRICEKLQAKGKGRLAGAIEDTAKVMRETAKDTVLFGMYAILVLALPVLIGLVGAGEISPWWLLMLLLEPPAIFAVSVWRKLQDG